MLKTIRAFIDIGSVGCWGEWNTACIPGGGGIFDILHPANNPQRQEILDAFSSLIDHYLVAVALLDRAGVEPDTLALEPLDLGIEGREGDGWYTLSQVTVD